MPCSLGLSQAKVGAKKWLTRADLAGLVEEARQILAANLSEPMTTKQVAARIGLSEHHFIRTFTAQFGQSPREFRAAARMQEAKRLAVETDLPLIEVAMLVGFGSPSSFARQFRLSFDCSPTEARAASRVQNSMERPA